MGISRHYAYAGDRRVHYRRSGSGPPLVLIHPAPGSSFGLEATMRALGEGHTLIAPDTPGAGESEALATADPTCEDYSSALAETLRALGCSRVDLYGSHTGATLALDFSVRFPEMVHRVVLNSLAIYHAEERADLLSHYTPPLEPDWAGSHLVRAWSMRQDMLLFWPWYRRSPSTRRAADMPTPEVLHDKVLDMLRAGTGYASVYRAGFRYKAAKAIREVTAPTLLTAAPDDPLADHLERLGETPESVTFGRRSGSERNELASTINEFLGDGVLPDAPVPPPVSFRAGTVRKDYAQTSVGQVMLRHTGEAGRPLVLLQASPPGSSAGHDPLMLAMAQDRRCLTLDTPGNGDSAAVGGEPSMTDLAGVLAEALDDVGFEEYDVYGAHTGAVLGMELAITRPQRVRRLILDGIPLYDADVTQDFVDNYQPPMDIKWDGSHLVWAWNYLRDVSLWWPFYRREAATTRSGTFPSVGNIHHSFVEFLKGAKTYHHNFLALWRYETAERLPEIKAPTLVCARPGDPWIVHLKKAAQLVPEAQIQEIEELGTPIHERYLDLWAPPATLDVFRAFLNGA